MDENDDFSAIPKTADDQIYAASGKLPAWADLDKLRKEEKVSFDSSARTALINTAACSACSHARVRCDKGKPSCRRCFVKGTNCSYQLSLSQTQLTKIVDPPKHKPPVSQENTVVASDKPHVVDVRQVSGAPPAGVPLGFQFWRAAAQNSTFFDVEIERHSDDWTRILLSAITVPSELSYIPRHIAEDLGLKILIRPREPQPVQILTLFGLCNVDSQVRINIVKIALMSGRVTIGDRFSIAVVDIPPSLITSPKLYIGSQLQAKLGIIGVTSSQSKMTPALALQANAPVAASMARLSNSIAQSSSSIHECPSLSYGAQTLSSIETEPFALYRPSTPCRTSHLSMTGLHQRPEVESHSQLGQGANSPELTHSTMSRESLSRGEARTGSTDLTPVSSSTPANTTQQARAVDVVMNRFCAWLDTKTPELLMYGLNQVDGGGDQGDQRTRTNEDPSQGSMALSGASRRRKRTRYDTNENDGTNDDSGDETGRKKYGKKSCIRNKDLTRRLACPFHKANPLLCRPAQSCRTPGFESTTRVKEHLYRVHKIHCLRCKDEFNNPANLGSHQELNPDCPVLAKTTDSLTLRQWHLLKSREERRNWSSHAQRETERWGDIYRTLFPGSEIPSAYISDDLSDYLFRALTRIGCSVIEAAVAGQKSEDASVLAQGVVAAMTREVAPLCEGFYRQKSAENDGEVGLDATADMNQSLTLCRALPGQGADPGTNINDNLEVGMEFHVAHGALDMDEEASRYIFEPLLHGDALCDIGGGDYFDVDGNWIEEAEG